MLNGLYVAVACRLQQSLGLTGGSVEKQNYA